jgi:protein-tyrosine phosphatase
MKPSIYWIDASGPARLAVLERPPGRERLEAALQGWRAAGIDVVVSLLTSGERSELGLSSEEQLCEANGLQFINFPIHDYGVPGSQAETLQFVVNLDDIWRSGKSIGLHCYASLGRAPLIAACLLMFEGQNASDAFALVGAARGVKIPQTSEQAEWGTNVARELQSSAGLG